MTSAEQFERDFPLPVFDEPPPAADAPAWMREAYAGLKAQHNEIVALWLALRAKFVRPN